MSGRRRLCARILCFGMLLVLFASFAYIACEADHDCAGETCAVCERIAAAQVLLRGAAALCVLAGVLSALPSALRALSARRGLSAPALSTPVCLKVRLND